MRVKAAIAGAALVALAVGTAADAAPIVITDNGVTVTATPTPMSGAAGTNLEAAGYQAWIINLSFAGGQEIIGVDFDAPILEDGVEVDRRGIYGILHQQWSDPGGDADYQPTPGGTSTTNVDSKFLTPPAVFAFLFPSEDNSLTGSPLANNPFQGHGHGTLLRSVMALESPAANWNAAYVVSNEGFRLFGAATGPEVADAQFDVFIPEPATMGLLAPLALGLLARRRRNA